MLPLLALAGCEQGEYALLVGGDYACLHHPSGRLECQWTDDATADEGELDLPATEFASVEHARNYLCGIPSGGDPVCWGAELWEEDPTAIPSDVEVASFFLGYSNACALTPDGSVRCWGNTFTGVNDTPDGHFLRGGAAASVACAQAEDASWACWGDNWGVDESNGFTNDWTLPEGQQAEVESGDSNICALDADGVISCWATSNFGVTHPPEGGGWRDLSVGLNHACAIDAADEVHCWGDLPYWRAEPTGTWRTFDAGRHVDCGMRTDGEIDCWGCTWTDPFTCDWDD